MNETVDVIIIGAGAAGMAATTCFGASEEWTGRSEKSQRVLLLEQHTAPGGSAGYFARGFPKRLHDAGATQLIACEGRDLQNQLFRLATGRELNAFQSLKRIPFIEHHFSEATMAGSTKVRFTTEGTFVCSQTGAELTEFDALVSFVKQLNQDAQWMWKVFDRFPQFPIRTLGDFVHLADLGFGLSPQEAWRAMRCMQRTVWDEAKRFGIQEHTRSFQIIEALLLDTSQCSAKETPYLVGAMGLSILQKGIYCFQNGMHDLFNPWLKGLQNNPKVEVLKKRRVTSLRFHNNLFHLTVASSPSEIEHFQARNVISTLPIDAIVELTSGTPQNQISQTKEWSLLNQTAQNTKQWQAVAIYGIAQETDIKPHSVSAPELPYFSQIFPREHDLIQHALYVSMRPTQQGRARAGERVSFRPFTATAHVDSTSDFTTENGWSSELCQRIKAELVSRVEGATGLKLENVELGTPQTFEKYTARPDGKVGGLVANFDRFLFRSLPSVISLGGKKRMGKLALAGDCFFPGQGVVAASMSGVLAWANITGHDPMKLFRSEL